MTAITSSKVEISLIGRLLGQEDRRELFEILLHHNKGDLKMSASQMGIVYRGIYRYLDERKRVSPNSLTSARILLYLTRAARMDEETKIRLSRILIRLEADIVASLFITFATSVENSKGDPLPVPPEIPYNVVGFLNPILHILLIDISTDPWLSVHPEEKRKLIMKYSDDLRMKIYDILRKYRP
jgi:hypothetical protein